MAREEHPPAFLLYAQDFVSDSKVEAMTTREVGAYFLLLCKAWHETPVATIPNNDRVLARWARLTPIEWAECRDAVLSPFKLCPDNRLLSPRLSSEYRKLMESRKKRSAAGRSGAEKRWQCYSNAMAMPMRSHGFANAEAMPKNAISISISKPIDTDIARAHDPPEPSRELCQLAFSAMRWACPESILASYLADGYTEAEIGEAIKRAAIAENNSPAYVRGILREERRKGPKSERPRVGKDKVREAPDYSDIETGANL
jgi:uncharacterized protein YdaU (DUF1376 family)